jgi:hypothetical protein
MISLKHPSDHVVYASVTAINGAGLSTTISSVRPSVYSQASHLILM